MLSRAILIVLSAALLAGCGGDDGVTPEDIAVLKKKLKTLEGKIEAVKRANLKLEKDLKFKIRTQHFELADSKGNLRAVITPGMMKVVNEDGDRSCLMSADRGSASLQLIEKSGMHVRLDMLAGQQPTFKMGPTRRTSVEIVVDKKTLDGKLTLFDKRHRPTVKLPK